MELGFLSPVIGAGFFSNQPVQIALLVGGIVSLVSGAVGTFAVLRGQSFAGHSLSDIGSTGGAAAFLIGVSPFYGFVAVNLIAATLMETISARGRRHRDVATGMVLGAVLGLAALFLYLDSTHTASTGTTINVLFGSIFTLPSGLEPVVGACGLVALGFVVVCYRPLLITSLSPELAAVRGIRVRLVAIGYLLALAIAVSLSAVTIGAILSTASLLGPAAAALRMTKRTGWAMALASGIGLCATWLGILLAYDSYNWPPQHRGWPVSFFVVALVFVFYLVTQFVVALRHRHHGHLNRKGR